MIAVSEPAKFLCICHYGHSRSVALARVLHARGYPAVAIGHATSADAVRALAEWADVICPLDVGHDSHVPTHLRAKVTHAFQVGPDRWSNPYNTDLLKLLDGKAESFLTVRNWPTRKGL